MFVANARFLNLSDTIYVVCKVKNIFYFLLGYIFVNSNTQHPLKIIKHRDPCCFVNNVCQIIKEPWETMINIV